MKCSSKESYSSWNLISNAFGSYFPAFYYLQFFSPLDRITLIRYNVLLRIVEGNRRFTVFEIGAVRDCKIDRSLKMRENVLNCKRIDVASLGNGNVAREGSEQ